MATPPGPRFGMSGTQEDDRPLPAAAAAALALGRFVEAIRQVRAAEGLGLAEAKERVEAHVRRNPGLRAELEARQARTKRALIRWVLVIDAILVAAVLWWLFGR